MALRLCQQNAEQQMTTTNRPRAGQDKVEDRLDYSDWAYLMDTDTDTEEHSPGHGHGHTASK